MPHEKQGATTLLDEEACFEDKEKFAPASTHLSSVKDILAADLLTQKVEQPQPQSVSENGRGWQGFCVNALHKPIQMVRDLPFQLKPPL